MGTDIGFDDEVRQIEQCMSLFMNGILKYASPEAPDANA